MPTYPISTTRASGRQRRPVTRARAGATLAALFFVFLGACSSVEDNTQWRNFASGREYQRARALQMSGRIDEARRIFRNLRRLDPANIAAFYSEMEVTDDVADIESLRAELDGLLRRTGEPELEASYLALLARFTNNAKRKEQMLQTAIDLDGKNSIAHAEYAMLLEARRGDAEAYGHWRRAVKGNLPPPIAFKRLATYEIKRHAEERAIELLESYLTLIPADPEILYDLGTLHLREGSPDKAEPYLEEAFEIDGQDFDVTMNLASAKIKNGRHDAALELLGRAHRLNPKEPEVYFNLGVLYADYLKKPEQAVANFQEYLKVGGEERMRTLSWIRQLRREFKE